MQTLFPVLSDLVLREGEAVELKHTEFLKYYSGIHRSMAWETLEPYEEAVLNEYILPFIGRPFFTEISEYSVAAVQDKPCFDECLVLLRRCLAWYMMNDAFIDQNVTLTDLGPQQVSDSGGTSQNPSQWAFKTKRWNLMHKADQYLDHLLQFLEMKAREDECDFSTWSAAVERRREKSAFFSSPAELDEYLNMQGSRRAYGTIIPYFRKAERRHLRPVLGQAFFEELAAHYVEPVGNTDLLDEVVKMVQHCLAEYGLLEALPHLSCVIGGESIIIVSQRDGFDERVSSGLVYNQAAISRLRQSAEENGATALQELRVFLRKNAESLPTYKNGEAYPRASNTTNVIADDDGGMVSF